MTREWSSGICECCEAGALTFIVGCCCHPIQVGINATKMIESFLLCCCPIEGHLMIRSKIRAEQGIEGSLVRDCFTIYWCTPCAVIQEANEINKIYVKEPL